jgi:hypothetical protein
MRRDPDESSNDGSQRGPAAELWASCSRCDVLHRPESEIAFDPICERCSRNGRTVELGARRFHALNERAIAGAVRETSPGNYALGYLDGSTFAVFYVGRSDSDVSATLHAWVDAPSRLPRRRSSPHARWRSRSGPPAGVGTRALGHSSNGIDTAYTHFAFCYAPTAIAAFERECRDFHELGGIEGLDNQRHPEPPQGSFWACPMHG